MKKILLIVMLGMIIMFCSFVSADLWDNVSAYYKFENQSDLFDEALNFSDNEGTVTYSTAGTLLGKAAQFSANNNLRAPTNDTWMLNRANNTISFWFNSTNAGAEQIIGAPVGGAGEFYLGRYNTGKLYIKMCGSEENPDVVVAPQGYYAHIVLVMNDTGGTLYVNNTIIQTCNGLGTAYGGKPHNVGCDVGCGSDIQGAVDEMGLWNRSLSASEVSDLYNDGIGVTYGEGIPPVLTLNVTLENPTNGQSFSIANITFNVTSNPVSYNATNVTFYVWHSNSTLFNTTINSTLSTDTNITNVSIHNFVLGSYIWNAEICGKLSNGTTGDICNMSISNFTFEIGASIDEENYSQSTYETSPESFTINITLIGAASLHLIELVYNGAAYPGTITSLGGDRYSVTRNIAIPSMNVSIINYSFYWRFSYTNAARTYQNSSFRNQSAERIWFSNCNATYPIEFINFTTKNASNPYPLLNATIKIAWRSYILGSNGTAVRNSSFEDISTVNWTWNFCMHPADKNYSVSATIEYDNNYSAKNYYYLTNASLSNDTELIDLYLLNDGLATLTVLEVVDGAQKALEDVYIQIQAYDVGTDTYHTVAMAKTDFNGEDLVYLNWYNTFYKYVLTQNGEVISITSPSKISATPIRFEVLTETLFDYDKFEDFVYNFYYNETTKNFVLTYTKPSGLVDSACLRVIKRNQTKDTQVCLTCEESTSATIYCNIEPYGNGTYIASFYATGSMKLIDSISEMIGIISEIYDALGNLDGTTLAIMFSGIVMTMFLITPVLGVIGMILGMIGATALGFQPIDYGTYLGIILVGGIIIWLLKR